jgi:hypothetical protein
VKNEWSGGCFSDAAERDGGFHYSDSRMILP